MATWGIIVLVGSAGWLILSVIVAILESGQMRRGGYSGGLLTGGGIGYIQPPTYHCSKCGKFTLVGVSGGRPSCANGHGPMELHDRSSYTPPTIKPPPAPR